MNIKEIRPIGYCYGVINAINLAKKIRKENPNSPIYVFGMIVHNEAVSKELGELGIVTIDLTGLDKKSRLNEFKPGDIVIFTAHGHDEALDLILDRNGVTHYDAVCKIVKMNMTKIQDSVDCGRDVIFIGKEGHPETEASISISPKVHLYDIKKGIDYSKVGDNPLVTNQTTLSFLEIEDIHKDIMRHRPDAEIIDEICSASRLRQQSIANLKDDYDLCLIVGSKKSSNTNKLYEIALGKKNIRQTLKINDKNDLKDIDLSDVENIVIASGTSTSVQVVEEIKKYLEENANGKRKIHLN